MSLTSYRAAPPRGGEREGLGLAGPGGDLLFRGLSRSTIGAEGFHGRVRDGIGCLAPRHDHQAEQGPGGAVSARAGSSQREGRVSSSGACRCVRRALADGGCRREGIKPIERLVPVGARVAALARPAYRRDGLSRLSARPGFEGGFPLRCFQRLSRPHLATRRCGWRHNRYTRGASIPVLSY
jgi:hypothetical protein